MANPTPEEKMLRPAATSMAWFYTPHSQMPPLLHGNVIQLGGRQDFTRLDETRARATLQELFPLQPGESVPRLDWSHVCAGHRTDREGGYTREWQHRPVLGESEDDRRAHLDGIGSAPPPPFQHGRQVGLCTWRDHQLDASQLMDQTMLGAQLTGPALIAGLHMATRGLEDVVAIAARPADVPLTGGFVNPAEGEPGHIGLFRGGTCLPDSTAARLEGLSRLGFPTAKALQEACFNRRFLVIPFNHSSTTAGFAHWTIGIFDRRLGHLLLWDTLVDDGHVKYGARARRTLEAMQAILAFNGQPYTFAFSVVPVSTQQDNWECGLLALEIVRQTLRGQVGLGYDQLCDMVGVSELSVNGRPTLPPSCTPELRLCDWALEPWRCDAGRAAYNDMLARIKGRWRLWSMEEIGLWDCRVWSQARDRTLTPKGFIDGSLLPWWQAALRQDASAAPQCPTTAAWTQRGGRPYVIDSKAILEYDWTRCRVVAVPETAAGRRALAAQGHMMYRQRPIPVLRDPLVAVAADVTRMFLDRGWVVDGTRVRRIGEPADGRAVNRAAAVARQCISIASTPAGSPALPPAQREASVPDDVTDAISVLSLDYVDMGGRMDGTELTGLARRADVNLTGLVEGSIPIQSLGATQLTLVESQMASMARGWPAGCEGGREMAIGLQEALGLTPAPLASTQFIGNSRAWLTVLPAGIAVPEGWEWIIELAYRG